MREHFVVLGSRLAVPLALPLDGVPAALDAALARNEPRVAVLLQLARSARRLRAESIDAALTPQALRVAVRVRGEALRATGPLHATVMASFGVPLDLQDGTFVTVPAPSPDAQCLPAAAGLALEWLARMRSMEAECVAGLDPEGPHQLRVAVRRLRTVLRLLERQRGASDVRGVIARVRALGDLAGVVRDHDVVLERISRLPVSDGARDRAVRHVASRRRRALARMQRVLCAPGVGASIETARAALEALARLPDERRLDSAARDLLDRSFRQFARQCCE
ncbi:MAG: CHAD domain-containing protein, partial [Deltaproteobacteria bacterium]